MVNGAAARLVQPGDMIIIAAYALIDEKELNSLNAVIVNMGSGQRNRKDHPHETVKDRGLFRAKEQP